VYLKINETVIFWHNFFFFLERVMVENCIFKYCTAAIDIPDKMKQMEFPEPRSLFAGHEMLEFLSDRSMHTINILSGLYLAPITLVQWDSSLWSTPCICDKSMCYSCHLYFIHSSCGNAKSASGPFSGKSVLFQVDSKTAASVYFQVRNVFCLL